MLKNIKVLTFLLRPVLIGIMVISGCYYGPPQKISHNLYSKSKNSEMKEQKSADKDEQLSPAPEASETYTSTDEKKLLAEIREYLGAPYKFGGTSKSGTDCSGLIHMVFKNAFDLSLPHQSSQLFELGTRISVKNWQLGDLLFFRTGRKKEISHVGIYLTGTKFVHATTKRGVIVSDFKEETYYRKRYAGARRVIDIQ